MGFFCVFTVTVTQIHIQNRVVRKQASTQMIKNPPATPETWLQPLGWEDALEEEMGRLQEGFSRWEIPRGCLEESKARTAK